MFLPLPTNKAELRFAVDQLVTMRRDIDQPKERIKKIEAYLKSWNIETVVVGVSGGIDSALVLALLSKIKGIKIHAVTISFNQYSKVFNPEYIYELKQAFSGKNIKWHDLEMSYAHRAVMRESRIFTPTPTVDANVSYAMRYLSFFAIAQAEGGITFGTTNLDEMGYAGWFGKNSDMMVDVQPIADLHKFEVVRWAELLGVPQCIVTRTPTGDLIDGTSDEENFGCTYNELSYFTALQNHLKRPLNPFLEGWFSKLIALHKKNAHKYQGQKFNPVFIQG
jgi:NAD+ synthetase